MDNFKRMFWFILSFLIFAGTQVINALFSMPHSFGLFHHTMKNISDMYPSALEPAQYTFTIWVTIFIFQLAWMVYALSTLCRTNKYGPVYLNPCVLPTCFHCCYIVSCLGSVGFAFLLDREYLLFATISLLVTNIFTILAIYINCKCTHKYKGELIKLGQSGDLIAIKLLIQNGLAIFLGWMMFSFLIMLSAALQYSPMIKLYLPAEKSAIICLCIMAVIPVIKSFMENTIYYDISKFVYGDYIANIWACTGVIVQLYSTPLSTAVIILFVALGINVAAIITKALVYACEKPTVAYGKL